MGTYFGEISKVTGKPEGNGLFESETEYIFSRFLNEKLRPGQSCLVVDKKTLSLDNERSAFVIRPNGTEFILEIGKSFTRKMES